MPSLSVSHPLAYTEPYDWPLTLRMIGAHTVPGAEELDLRAGRYARLLPTSAGPVKITLFIDDPPRVVIEHNLADEAEMIMARVRHWLDLDHDPRWLAGLYTDPVLGPELKQRPGLRRVGYPTAFEAVVLTILGQQVSLAAGRTFAARLVARFGRPGPGGLRQFPTAERLADLPVSELRAAVGVTGARARFLSAAAQAFADDPGLAAAGTPVRGEHRSSRRETERAARGRTVDRGVPADAAARRSGCLPGRRSGPAASAGQP